MLSPPNLPEVTFEMMATQFFDHVLSLNIAKCSQQVHKYEKQNTKSSTRKPRRAGTAPAHHIQGDVRIPTDWREFLRHDDNKSKLARFYQEVILKLAGPRLQKKQISIISGVDLEPVQAS